MPDTERELFDSAMNNEPEAQPVTIVEPEAPKEPEPETAEDERARDEKGRFAPKEEAEPEKPEQAKEPDKPQAIEPVAQQPVKEPERQDHRVPLAEHLSEREKRQAAERRAEDTERQLQNMQRQLSQLQQSRQTEVPKPNLFENPEQWEQTQQQQFQSALLNQSVQFSEQLARIKHGDEAFDAADKAAQQIMSSGQHDPELFAVGRAPNPGEALVQWHKRKQTLERLGNLDPDKYVEQEIEKRLNDPAFLSKAVERARVQAQGNPGPAIQTQPVTKLPSLNRQTSAANNDTDSDNESDAELFKSAIRR